MKTDAAEVRSDADAPDRDPATRERSGDPAAQIADPFAVDLFAARRAPADLPALSEAAPLFAAWHAKLPRTNVEQARLSLAVTRLPPSYADSIAEAIERTLARLTRRAAEDVRLTIVDLREAELAAEAQAHAADAGAQIAVEFGIEPAAYGVTIEMTTEFARRLVGVVLGDDGEDSHTRRDLSVVETAVAEFVCLNAARAANRVTGEPLWRLKRIGGRHETDARHAHARGYVIAVRVAIGTKHEAGAHEGIAHEKAAPDAAPPTIGVVRCYVPAAALDALDAVAGKLLHKPRDARDLPARFGRIAPYVRTRIAVGETTLAASDVAGLEAGDVVLVDRPEVRWRAAGEHLRIEGDVRVRIGDGGVVIAGNVGGAAARRQVEANVQGLIDAQPPMLLRLARIEAGAKTNEAQENVTMDEMKEGGAGSAEDSGVLENLLLTVRVELGARRFTLDQLANLRPGQIVELGCRATDPVELTTENGAVARGELIDIEGRLGVRVTRVLV